MSDRQRPLRLSACVLLPLLLALPAGAAAAQDDADHELGRQVFLEGAQPPCALCHILADAQSTGRIGPNLDQLQPSEERVMQALRSGPGAMPDFSDILSEEEMQAVAAYVAAVSGGS